MQDNENIRTTVAENNGTLTQSCFSQPSLFSSPYTSSSKSSLRALVSAKPLHNSYMQEIVSLLEDLDDHKML